MGHGESGMERILGSFAHYFQTNCLIPIASVPIAQQLTVTLTVQIALLKFRQDLVDKLF
jgi:hypothetical protein